MFSAQPTRAAGLSGTLGPRPRLVPSEDASTPVTETADDMPVPARDSGGSKPSRKARSTGTEAGGEAKQDAVPAPARRLVVVYVTQADFDWIVQRRKTTDLTNAQIVLQAIEDWADHLPGQFHKPTTKKAGLFSTPTTPGHRPRERHVQLGLNGILPDDRQTLDRLVVESGAGSLSALVRGALALSQEKEQS